MSPLEITGVVTALVSVWLTVRQNIWCWPVGIISVLAYAWLFYRIHLYADAGLQIFFLATSINGWWLWLHGGANRDALPVTRLTRQQVALLAPATLVSVVAMGLLFARYTDAHLPFWDSAASGTSVVAQVLLMRKKLESWILWLAVDVVYVGIYVYKNVYLTAGLYALFLVLAWAGLKAWRSSLRTA